MTRQILFEEAPPESSLEFRLLREELGPWEGDWYLLQPSVWRMIESEASQLK